MNANAPIGTSADPAPKHAEEHTSIARLIRRDSLPEEAKQRQPGIGLVATKRESMAAWRTLDAGGASYPRSVMKGAVRIRIAGVVGVMAVLLAACGDPVGEVDSTQGAGGESPEAPVGSDGDLRVIVMPDVDGGLPPEVIVGCRAGPSFPASALEDVPPVEEVELAGLEDAMQSFLGNEEGQFWPQDGWRVLHATEKTVLIVHHDAATRGISFMNFASQDGSWRWAGASSGGPCPLQTTLPEGLGVVEWRIDPAGPPLTPDSTSIPVLVTELDCASGRLMGDRLLGPEVVMTDMQVLIAFAARPLAGNQSCPSNPEQSVTFDLPEPLGEREIIDGLATGLDLSDFLE